MIDALPDMVVVCGVLLLGWICVCVGWWLAIRRSTWDKPDGQDWM